MKTRTKALIIVSILAALCIGFLIGISVNSSSPDRSNIAGSFGKVEKHRNIQMTEKDVLLRSELLSDSVQLKNMLQGLVFFTLFTEEVSHHIDSCVNVFQTHGMGADEAEANLLKDLSQYSEFIKNNNQTLQVTITMLNGFYTGESVDQSLDVEKNLRDFGSYVNRLSAMDSVLTASIVNFDDFMLQTDFQESKGEIAKLKSIRDQLLANGIQLSGLLNDKDLAAVLLGYALESQEKFALLSEQQISAYRAGSRENLQSSSDLGLLASLLNSSTQVSANFNLSNTGDLGVFYNSSQMQFFLFDRKNLNALESLDPGLQNAYKALAFLGSGTLNVVMSNYSIQNILQSQSLGSLSVSKLALLSQENMNAVFQSAGSLGSLLNFLNSQNLGVTM